MKGNLDEDVSGLFESAGVEPTEAERRAILAAAEPILAEHAAAAATRRRARPSAAERLRALLAPRPRLALAAVAAVLAAVVVFRHAGPATRETRSAPLQSWTEYVSRNSGRPFTLGSESFGRPY